MAMRYYNHASFVMSLLAKSEQRERRTPMAIDYVRRAGLLYSWGLRFFLFVAPVVMGLVTSSRCRSRRPAWSWSWCCDFDRVPDSKPSGPESA